MGTFDFATFLDTLSRTKRIVGLPNVPKEWREVSYDADDYGVLVHMGAAFSGVRYQERTIYVTKAGVVHWDVVVCGQGYVRSSEGVKLDVG